MQTARQMYDKARRFMANINGHVQSIAEGSEGQLVGLLQGQLMHGKDGDGNPLKQYVDPEYAEFKKELNPLGVTDLKLHGFFYKGMRFQVLSDRTFAMVSDDVKYEQLMQKYGYASMKLSEDSYIKFREERFNPLFLQMFARATGAEFL